MKRRSLSLCKRSMNYHTTLNSIWTGATYIWTTFFGSRGPPFKSTPGVFLSTIGYNRPCKQILYERIWLNLLNKQELKTSFNEILHTLYAQFCGQRQSLSCPDWLTTLIWWGWKKTPKKINLSRFVWWTGKKTPHHQEKWSPSLFGPDSLWRNHFNPANLRYDPASFVRFLDGFIRINSNRPCKL